MVEVPNVKNTKHHKDKPSEQKFPKIKECCNLFDYRAALVLTDSDSSKPTPTAAFILVQTDWSELVQNGCKSDPVQSDLSTVWVFLRPGFCS